MNKTLILSLSSLFLVSFLSPKAQQRLYTPRQDSASVERVISSLSVQFLGASLQQERRIATHTTVIYGLGMFGSKISENQPNFQTRFIASKQIPYTGSATLTALTPYAYTELRQYFSLARRVRKERNTRFNSANYVSFFAELPLATGKLKNSLDAGLAYPVGLKAGLRRCLTNFMYLDLGAGLVYKINSTTSEISTVLVPRVDVSLGFAID